MEPLLDESFLRQLQTIKTLAQKGVKGENAGIHRSMKSGSSMEFMDYRKYQPGDDIRYVDWNVYARTNRLFVKLFHAEKDQKLYIMMDASGSMATGNADKLTYVKKITAALGYLGLAGQDQVGITTFSDRIEQIKSPQRGKDVYLSLLDFLTGLNAKGQTDINAVLESFCAAGHQPGQVVVISDFLSPKGFKKGFRALAGSKFKLSVIQVVALDEIDPDFKGRLSLADVETGQQLSLQVNDRMKALYRQKMTAYLSDIRMFCQNRGIDYHLVDTSVPFTDFFLGYLGARQERNQ